MIYFENCSKGTEGFNTHVIAYTLCISLSNFLDRDFYFDHEIPSSSPPGFASIPGWFEKFGILVESPRSLVSDLVTIPNRRVREIDLHVSKKIRLQHTHSHFVTTEALHSKYASTMIFEHFGMGRTALTREGLNAFDLIEWTDTRLSNPSYFYLLDRPEKQDLLRSVNVTYLPEIESLAATIISELGSYNSVHIRLGDFLKLRPEYGASARSGEFASYIRTALSKDSPILIATDGLEERHLLESLFEGFSFRFIDEVIFDRFRGDFEKLPFTDFNVLTVLNQLICAASELFVGTYYSTFTGVIHKLRQERHQKKDFMFFPDPLVSRHLRRDLKLVPDRQGFFDWNRFSAFAPSHFHMAWAREWDYDLTTVDL
ncbi:MAG: O-fucosyltransferase family protein [Pyrinomonadaceae bacterium]